LVAKIIVGLWGGRLYGLTRKGSLIAAFSLGQRDKIRNWWSRRGKKETEG